MIKTYTIEPCTGGVKLRLYVDDEEEGGGFFPDNFDGAMNFAYNDAQEYAEEWIGEDYIV